ncbi:MAG: hypothetical protein HZC17_03135 [Candidatus Omnitrophica bacterium]|nr:hypothetical protein [Candidatus Omnitrophota bacterium]
MKYAARFFDAIVTRNGKYYIDPSSYEKSSDEDIKDRAMEHLTHYMTFRLFACAVGET